MTVNIKKEELQIEYLVAEEGLEKALETRISIPLNRPELKELLDVLGQVEEVEGVIVEDGVEITGKTLLTLIYANKEEGYSFVQEGIDFSLFFSIPKAQAGMDLLVDSHIKDISYMHKERRAVEALLKVHVKIRVLEKRTLSFLKGVEGLEKEAELHQEELYLEELLEEGHHLLEIKGELREKDLGEILHYDMRIKTLQEEQQETRVVVSGELLLSLIYSHEDGEGPFFLQEIFPFKKELKTLKASVQGHLINLTQILKTQVNLLSVGHFQVETLLHIFMKMVRRDSFPVITDIESKRVDVQRDILKLEQLIDANNVINNAVFNYNLSPEQGDLGEILHLQASLRESITEATSGGVKITGHVEASILYQLKGEEGEIQYIRDSFIFDHFVSLSRAREGMMAHTTIFLRGIEGRILNERTLELNLFFQELVKVTSLEELMIATDLVVVSPLLEGVKTPSMVLYVIRPHDTLGKIARRFGANREEILKDNQGRINDPHQLMTGEKLFIRRNLIGSEKED